MQRNAFRGHSTKYKCLENFVLYGSVKKRNQACHDYAWVVCLLVSHSLRFLCIWNQTSPFCLYGAAVYIWCHEPDLSLLSLYDVNCTLYVKVDSPIYALMCVLRATSLRLCNHSHNLISQRMGMLVEEQRKKERRKPKKGGESALLSRLT